MTHLPNAVVGLIGNADALLAELSQIDDEIGHRLLASSTDYEFGLIRFLPKGAVDGRQIVHANQDVLCWVVRGSGRLTLGHKVQELAEGDICRIPAGQPHDFAAVDRLLVLLYVKTRVQS